MNASRRLLTTLLVTSAAWSSEAQRLAPIGPVAPVTPSGTDPAPAVMERTDVPGVAYAAVPRDTMPAPRPLSRTGAILGGIGGGALGAVVGTLAGAATAEGCHGEFCGFENAAIGLVLGESLGLAVGAHLGSGSADHGKIMMTTLTSAAILVGGTLAGAGMQQAGVVMIPLTPALQLAATWSIESHR